VLGVGRQEYRTRPQLVRVQGMPVENTTPSRAGGVGGRSITGGVGRWGLGNHAQDKDSAHGSMPKQPLLYTPGQPGRRAALATAPWDAWETVLCTKPHQTLLPMA
jgi:hypothetical protein